MANADLRLGAGQARADDPRSPVKPVGDSGHVHDATFGSAINLRVVVVFMAPS
jgi:hypothetical protein